MQMMDYPKNSLSSDNASRVKTSTPVPKTNGYRVVKDVISDDEDIFEFKFPSRQTSAVKQETTLKSDSGFEKSDFSRHSRRASSDSRTPDDDSEPKVIDLRESLQPRKLGYESPIDFTSARKNYNDIKSQKPREYVSTRDYRSNNPNEDRDNDCNNPDWDDWKNARTDAERKKLAMRKFGNLEHGDPKRCMTFHGYRRTLACRKANMVEFESGVRLSRSHRIKICDGRMRLVDLNRNSTAMVGKKRQRDVNDVGREMSAVKRGRLDGTINNMTFRQFQDFMLKALLKYKKKAVFEKYDGRKSDRTVVKEWNYFMKHFESAIPEIKNFAEYYTDTPTLLFSQNEADQFECIERMFAMYVEFYGPNRRVYCKECTKAERHRNTVLHRV